MKKIISFLTVFSIMLSMGTSIAFAGETSKEINELTAEKYANELKTYIKKDGIEEIKKAPSQTDSVLAFFNLSKNMRAVKKKGLQLGYIEPTIKVIESNLEKTNKLISFLESNKTSNNDINETSQKMLTQLNKMKTGLELINTEYNNQLGFDTSDTTKLENLKGPSLVFGSEQRYAYDYIDQYYGLLNDVQNMYEHIKDLS